MLKLFKNLKKNDLWLIFASLFFIIAQVYLDLKMPDFMAEITRLVTTEGSEMSDILVQGSYMLACSIGSLAAAVVVGFIAARVAASFGATVRNKVFDKVEHFSLSEMNQFSTPSLITRSTNDITQIVMVVAMGMQILIKAPILATWGIIKISNKSWEWTAVTGAFIAFIIVVIAILMVFALPKFKIMQKLTDNVNRVMRENLSGIRVVRAYNAESYQENRFEIVNDELKRTQLFTSRLMSVMSPVMTIVMSGLSLSIYWIGAILINNAASIQDQFLLFSDMVVFSSYAMQIVMAFIMMTMIFVILPRATVSANRINEVLDTVPAIVDGTIINTTTGIAGSVEMKNVSFKYPDAEDYILKDITFTAEQGETIAFIGSTGSGKSTLINLIPRFYDASEGAIFINGVDVRNYTQESLHNLLGYIPQKAVLFSGTIRSNIAYGDNGQGPITDEQVYNAIAIAQGKEFIEGLEDGLDAPVAQGGTNFSGGQKQRIAIARAIARNPEILIFDDSFSALDYKTDKALREALAKETKGVTSFIVAQRISTIQDADKIIVLDEGEIVGMGTHDELIKSCAVYQEIAYSQLTEEELNNEQSK